MPDNTPVQLSEDEVKQLRETAAEAVALRAEVTALTEAKQAFEARAAAIEAKERTQRFTNVVRGRDGQGDGAAWPGAIEDNVAHLVALAETLGEESDLFKNHVATMSAAAKTLAEAGAFKPIGSSEAGTGGSAFDEVEQAARTLMREDSALTYSAAMSRVFSEKPELYERHRLASIARTPAAE